MHKEQIVTFCTDVQNNRHFCFLYMPIHKYINILKKKIYIGETIARQWSDKQIILEKKVI